MLAYIVRRLLLMIPTLLGIMVLNFAVIQVAPGGPVEQLIAEIEGRSVSATARTSTVPTGVQSRMTTKSASACAAAGPGAPRKASPATSIARQRSSMGRG